MEGMELCVTLIWLLIVVSVETAIRQERCNGEIFEPTCDEDSVIKVYSAMYGYMERVRCFKTDDYLGCSSNVLNRFEHLCSGKRQCQIIISVDLHRDEPGACKAFFAGYAAIEYDYIKVAAITPDMCHDNGMKLSSRNSLISNMILREKCSNGRLKLVANQGQRINISITEFSGQNNLPLGSITEQRFGNVVYPKTGIKTHHVITSLANELEIDLSRANADVAFLYDVTVLGCVDLTPPVGAWMTRDDNVIEIGCHSGSKTWRLECIDNEWTGVTGNCGFESQAEPKSGTIRIKKAPNVISMDVIAFGVCSLIILLSACIFLAGTLLLERKVVPPQKLAEYDPLTGNPEMSGNCLTYDPNTASYVLYGNTHK